MDRRLSVPIFGLALFLFSAGFPPLDDAAEVDLTAHMAQHVLIILAGVAIAYPLVGRGLRDRRPRRWVPGLALLVASFLLVFWHLPPLWDSAVLNPWVHMVEHLSFLSIGLLSGSWILLLSDSRKVWALTAAFFGHMVYAVLLISPWSLRVYELYPLPDQQVLGWVLLLTGPSLAVGIAYLIARNPEILAGVGAARVPKVAEPRGRGGPVPAWVAKGLTLALVLIAVAYFAATIVAVSGPSPVGGTVVTISETPVSWQYSPQDVKVVLGVNSTVTWVSRSLSFDSVTDRGGAFASGPIGPGQSFSHTFTEVGVYSYYCVYHPWMEGTVTVVAPRQ